MISILDLNIGNLRSLSYCLDYIGIKFRIINNSKEINKSNILIIPGAGSFDYAMSIVKKNNLNDSLKKFVEIKKKPLLGICVGMQILFEKSEESKKKGLSFLKGKFIKLKNQKGYFVPNVGFSKIRKFKQNGIFKDFTDEPYLYFTNSYALKSEKKQNFNKATTQHSFEFVSAFEKENITGFQFRPELSHSTGMLMLKNFFIEKI